MADPDPNTIMQEIISIFQDLQNTKYMLLVGYTVLLYDHALTFAAEYSLIWRGKFGIVSALFLYNRYTVPMMLAADVWENFALGGPHAVQWCRIWAIVQGFMTISNFMCVHIIVALRVHALLGGMAWVARLLWFTGILYVIACCGLAIAALVPAISPWPNHLSVQFGECYAELPWWLWMIWLPSVVYETLLFFLTMVAAVRQWRARQGLDSLSMILFRDGLLYFVSVSLCTLFAMLVWLAAPQTLMDLGRYFALAMVNVAGSRLVLNLKAFAAQRREASASATRPSTSHRAPRGTCPDTPGPSSKCVQQPPMEMYYRNIAGPPGYDPAAPYAYMGAENWGHMRSYTSRRSDAQIDDCISPTASSALHARSSSAHFDPQSDFSHHTGDLDSPTAYYLAHPYTHLTDGLQTLPYQSPTSDQFAGAEDAQLIPRQHARGGSDESYTHHPYAEPAATAPMQHGHPPTSFVYGASNHRARISRVSDMSGSAEVVYGYAE